MPTGVILCKNLISMFTLGERHLNHIFDMHLGITTKSFSRLVRNSFQLYFEVENLDEWQNKIGKTDGIEFILLAKEYPWGQRVMRFYYYDKHIIEVAESMEFVAKRFLAQGLSIEEAAKRTMFPVEYIKNLA